MADARRESSPGPASLEPLINPRSVAVVGASDDRTRIGGRPLHYLLGGSFPGQVFAVNANRDTVQGIPAVPRIEDLGAAVDLAIVAVPGPAVMDTLEACARLGVGAALVFSSGFAELSDEGREQQARIRGIARASGMRILGPNCLGLYNAAIGLFATFSTTIELGIPEPGPVAVVSQSGAYGGHVAYLARRRGIQAGMLVTTGNECDVELAECIAWMAQRDDVKVIAAVAEGPRDGAALVDALENARRLCKPVVFLKMGRSAVGADAARSHTDSLAGEDAVYDAVLAAHGAYRARDTEQLLDVAYAASFGLFPHSRNVGLLSISGGAGIQLADAAERFGLDVTPMPEATQARIRARMPFASPRNPVDITAQVFNDPELLTLNLDAMLDEARYPAIVSFFTYVAGTGFMGDRLVEVMSAARARHPERLLVQCVIASREVLSRYEAAGCPCFEDPDRAVRAVAALARFAEAFADRRERPRPARAVSLPGGPLDELESLQILVDAGLPRPPLSSVESAEAAVRAARSFDAPVVMKICSAAIAHKSDIGGVLFGVRGDAEVAAGFERLMQRARAITGTGFAGRVVVAPMAAEGLDMILGVRRDPLFGPMVMVGLGGIFVELLNDVALAPTPIGVRDARAMLETLRCWPLLAGARGAPPADVDALCACIEALSRFSVDTGDDLDSVDINPLRVFSRGQGVRVLDALVIPAERRNTASANGKQCVGEQGENRE